jgi:hypothetical protein
MLGDERKRFCGECKLNVYNLSGMTQYDAENLLRNSEGRLCVRYFERPDGTVLTQNCPVGWAKVKQRTIAVSAAAFALALSFFGTLITFAMFGRKVDLVKRIPIPFTTPTPKIQPLMGAVAMPTPKNKPTPSPTPKADKETPMMGKVAMPPSKEIREQVLHNARA